MAPAQLMHTSAASLTPLEHAQNQEFLQAAADAGAYEGLEVAKRFPGFGPELYKGKVIKIIPPFARQPNYDIHAAPGGDGLFRIRYEDDGFIEDVKLSELRKIMKR